MRKLLIATRNKGKIPEIKAKLDGLDFEFVSLEDVEAIPDDFDVEETGKTFEENAILKARAYGDMSGLLTLAEDSGLCIDALDGRPGVHTARYGSKNNVEKNKQLLEELKSIPEEERGASYVSAGAIYDPGSGRLETFEGIYRGRIANEPMGDNGFGQDPIFFNAEKNRTNAQMSLEEKNAVSHRGKMLDRAREILLRGFS
ncbi:MAG: RdgB/HAM1 family non-canonical purine NTP pyrophosphatase [bacterium]|nr:RdgB/HAM1 family non-canonical purine NTP pyrophosphatase [bacterium]